MTNTTTIIIPTTTLVDGYVITYVAANSDFEAKPAPSSFTAGGDLSGSSSSQTVTKIQGNSVLSGTLGATQDGYMLTWVNSVSQYQAKPAASVSGNATSIQGNAVQSGTNGATQDGYVLTWVNASSQYQTKIPVGSTGPAGPTGPSGTVFLAENITVTGRTSGTGDTTIYTAPAFPSGNGRVIVSDIFLRLKTALVGSGSNTLTIGSSSDTTGYMLAQTITSGLVVGSLLGPLIADHGALFIPAEGYNARLNASSAIVVTCVAVGSVSTAPVFEAVVLGFRIGT